MSKKAPKTPANRKPTQKRSPRGVTSAPLSTNKGAKDGEPNSVGSQKVGRPSKYSDGIVATICERLSNGEPLAQICREKNMPTDRTIRSWQEANEVISSAIAYAREAGEEVLLAECLTIADSPTSTTAFGSIDGGHIQEKRLRIETRLKLLAKWNPKKYGEKIDHTSDGKALAVPIVTFQSQPPSE